MTHAPTRATVRAEIDRIIAAAPRRWHVVDEPWTGIAVREAHQPDDYTAFDVITDVQRSGARNGSGIWRIEPMAGRDGHIANEARERLVRQIHRHLRRTARNAALGDRIELPWAHTMHRLPLAAMREANLDPTLILTETGRLAIQWLEKRIDATPSGFSIEDGRIDVADVTFGDGQMRIIGAGRPALIVCATLPETVLVGLPGRLLSEVVDHPIVRRAGPLRIENVFSTGGTDPWVTFALEDAQDFIHRPPVGTDRRWARMPFHPHSLDMPQIGVAPSATGIATP